MHFHIDVEIMTEICYNKKATEIKLRIPQSTGGLLLNTPIAFLQRGKIPPTSDLYEQSDGEVSVMLK